MKGKMAHEFYKSKPNPETRCYYPIKYITYEMCLKAFEEDKWTFPWIPEHHKTVELCLKAIEKFGFQAFQWIPAHVKVEIAAIWFPT